MATPPRRLPAPWTVTPFEGGYAVEDSGGVRLAYVYFGTGTEPRPDLLTEEDARLVATGIAHLPELIRAAEEAPEALPQARPAQIAPPAEVALPVRPPRPAAPVPPRLPTARVRIAEDLAPATGPETRKPTRPWRRSTLLPWVLPAGFMVVALVVLLHAFDDPETGRSWEASSFRKFLSLSR